MHYSSAGTRITQEGGVPAVEGQLDLSNLIILGRECLEDADGRVAQVRALAAIRTESADASER